MTYLDNDLKFFLNYKKDWNKFARDILRAKLDPAQQAILESVQNNRRTVVRSGHARGKDFTSAVACMCFVYLNCPSKVIMTAPTGRQVVSIMMAEIGKLYKRSNDYLAQYGRSLGGELQNQRLIFGRRDWFIEGFKAEDKSTEAWTGYHSQSILVTITEASGIDDETFNAIEGLLTGELSRLLLVGNPNRSHGEFFNAFRSPLYNKFVLSCLDAPNVVEGKTIIPGQVDYEWVREHVQKQGWTTRISKDQVSEKKYFDFNFEGNWYRPTDLFRIKVLGEFPEQSEDSLVPSYWLEMAVERWKNIKDDYYQLLSKDFRSCTMYNKLLKLNLYDYLFMKLGVDVAGMGNDMTVFTRRFENFVFPQEIFSKQKHMVTAGKIMQRLEHSSKVFGGCAYIDTIGEGAGVFSRIEEQLDDVNSKIVMRDDFKIKAISVKFSESAYSYHDVTGERTFVNMRAYCMWAVRDALDPALGGSLALPLDEELFQELTETIYETRSDGKIKIEPKENLKERIKRSPDKLDSLAVTYYPRHFDMQDVSTNTLEGLGIF